MDHKNDFINPWNNAIIRYKQNWEGIKMSKTKEQQIPAKLKKQGIKPYSEGGLVSIHLVVIQ